VPDDLSFEGLLADVRRKVDAALEVIWNEAAAEYEPHGEAVARPLAAARALCLRGGKRLRAGLVAAGHALGSGQNAWEPALSVCCAVELLQAYFLIHDDWMDQDRMRRGGPSVHASLEEFFPSAHVAASGAVLAGDYTLALATRTLSRTPHGQAELQRLLSGFAQMQLDAVVGQQLDVLGDGSNLDEVYRLKTASYTVLGPLALGLTLSGHDAPAGSTLQAFAVPVGIAFQLRDDLIGTFGDPTATGKPKGSDVLAGKNTLLLNTALQMGTPEAVQRIRAAFGNSTADAGTLERALSALESSGAKGEVERRILELVAQARIAIQGSGFDARGRRLLEGMLQTLTQRRH
jgi:geranylgeranyl diphosphate synthase type I